MFLYSVVQSSSENWDISKEGGIPSGEKKRKQETQGTEDDGNDSICCCEFHYNARVRFEPRVMHSVSSYHLINLYFLTRTTTRHS
jgi:hypothetical protein